LKSRIATEEHLAKQSRKYQSELEQARLEWSHLKKTSELENRKLSERLTGVTAELEKYKKAWHSLQQEKEAQKTSYEEKCRKLEANGRKLHEQVELARVTGEKLRATQLSQQQELSRVVGEMNLLRQKLGVANQEYAKVLAAWQQAQKRE